MSGGDEASRLLDTAAELERRARCDEALDLLQTSIHWPAPYNERGLLLRASILLQSAPIAALDELPDDANAFETPEGRVGFLVTSARAHRLLRNWRSTEALLNAAEAEIAGDANPEWYRIAYMRAHVRWNQREYDPHDANLQIALDAPDAAVRFDAHNLRAWMHAGLGNHREQIDGLLECLQIYRARPHECRSRSVAVTLHSLLDFAWERGEPHVAQEALCAFNALEWTPELRVYEFLSLRALAWHAFLQGQADDSERYLSRALHDSPGPGWALMAFIDREYMAALSSRKPVSWEWRDRICPLADEIDWRTTRHEERMSLLALSVLLAPTDLIAAERYVSTYHNLYTHSMHEGAEASHEPPRVLAMQKYADGRIEQFRGNERLAARLLSDAYTMFSNVGHAFRALLTAHALYEITGQAAWLDAAFPQASKFPGCAIARDLYEMRARRA